MEMKIFWSWQSDTPGKTGRHFVRQTLLDAIRDLKQPEDVEEPTERERKDALHLDQDRQGIPGSPDLFRTILEKIDAIELGYALKALSDRNVLMVLNTHYGDRAFPPFDLAHKAGPIMFHLAPGADKKAIETEVAKLKGRFVVALRPYLEQLRSKAALPAFNETPTTVS